MNLTARDLPIPRIVLAGDHNAGKTALVERLCSLSMDIPSYNIMEWHVSPGPTFAQVYIAWRLPLDDLGPRIPFGCPVNDASSLENIVRRAQLAIFLHDDKGSQVSNYSDATVLTLHASLANLKSLTSHVIHIVYQHPDILWEATIVDLPGVLTNGPSNLITMSEEITLANIKVATNTIVVVMPLTSVNCWSTTWNLVQQEDPDQTRTISLVTKPAGVSNAADIWHDLLKRNPMSNRPPICVYHPREGRQHLSLSYSRSREHDFFVRSAPWSINTDHRFLGLDTFLAEAKRISNDLHFTQATIGWRTLVRKEMNGIQRPATTSRAEVDDITNNIGPVGNAPHKATVNK